MDEENKISPKVSGYLEKKGKMKMMGSYKKYWFVLEGRLLLYYRSKDEYDAISPCKGSINLGPPCNVKPCSSTHGVFQIETRTSTITLRAENQEDQNRWMQGIISALNQNKNSTKLGHFRYSLNELPQEEITPNKLKRKNSTPPSTDSTETQNQPNRGIIQRLQKIGAQSYGGSMGSINKIMNSKKHENSNSDESLNPTDVAGFRNSISVENDQYKAPSRNVISENINLRTEKTSFENVYERISRASTESTNGSEDINFNYHTSNKKTDKEHKLYSSCEKIRLRKMSLEEEITDRPSTFLLENEVYDTARNVIVHQKRTIRRKENRPHNEDDRPTTFILENDVYATPKTITVQKDQDNVTNKMKFSESSSENIYTEPKCTELIDHNENNLIVRKAQYTTNGEENAYSVIKLYDSDKNIVTNNTSEYEDLDIVEYAELKDQDNYIYSELPRKGILKKEKKKKVKKIKTDHDGHEVKLKKTSSFIKRVWKRKNKPKESENNDENLYETVPASAVEKVGMSDDTAIQMLSELHTILENKKPILSKQLSEESHSKYTQENTQDKDVLSRNSSPTNDDTAVQMLTELQNILENKKNILTARMSIEKEERKIGVVKSEKNSTQNEIQKNEDDIEGRSTNSGSGKTRPLLPPKTHITNVDSPYHDIPKNNQPINKMLPPKKKQKNHKIKSLDEILDDLDKVKSEDNKNKVKKLIKHFSDSDFNEADVVLRTHKKTNSFSKDDVDSDELNRLLNELTKVTCAPILTPGVTSSLINPNLTDEELLNLIPKHRRRFSEPDYDIPRPHKSLTNLPKKESSTDNAIGSTRFFGPILKPSDINIKSNNTKNSSEDISGMTPDSLEVEAQACPHPSYISEDEKNFSYTSHNYVSFKHYNSCGARLKKDRITHKTIPATIENPLKCFDKVIIENDIYSQPKSLHKMNTVRGRKMNDAHSNFYFKNNKHLALEIDKEKSQEVFEDSLEACNIEAS